MIAVYLTRYSENQWLDYVWAMSRNPETDRIDLLRQMTRLKMARPSDWDLRAVRQAAATLRAPFPMVYASQRTMAIHAESCWACLNQERRLYWHHVITVQHGGSSQPRNLVPLCHRCHGLVHLHLPKPTTRENRFGWTWLGDMTSRVTEVLSRVVGAQS